MTIDNFVVVQASKQASCVCSMNNQSLCGNVAHFIIDMLEGSHSTEFQTYN